MKFVRAKRVTTELFPDMINYYLNLAQVQHIHVEETAKQGIFALILRTLEGTYMLADSFPTANAAHIWVRTMLPIAE